MAGKILGIEVGTRMTYVVEMDYKVKTPKIYHFFSIPTPEGITTDGSLRVMPEFTELIRNALTERKIKTKKVVFVMNSTRIANREVMIPIVKEKQIHDLLITNSAEFFPVDLTQYELVHNIVEKVEAEKKLKLSVFAVPNDIVSSYTLFADALNVEIEALDYIGNSILQGMLHILKEEVKVEIHLDENTSILTLAANDKLEIQRNISYGIADAVDAVIESELYEEAKDFASALHVLRTNRCINAEFENRRNFAEESDTDEETRFRNEVTDSVRALVGNIGRILDYYTSKNQDVSIERIWLTGVGAECKGLSELLENELNVKVSPVTEIPDTIVNRNAAEGEFWLSEYATTIASTFKPLAFGLEKGKKDRTQQKNEMFAPGVVCAACLTASAVLVLSTMIPSAHLKQEKHELTKKIEALQEAEDIYQKYQLTLEEYSQLQQMYNLTKTPDDALLAFLGEMEAKMPTEIIVENLSAGTGGVTMDIRVSKKTVAADVLVQLREFETLSSVATSGLTETKEEGGRSSVTFSVNCQYQDADAEETGEAAENGEAAAAETDTETADGSDAE